MNAVQRAQEFLELFEQLPEAGKLEVIHYLKFLQSQQAKKEDAPQ